jgi:NAD(P)-dependent dehydrogenase (short-subunit alcohol dehydrogenase family)
MRRHDENLPRVARARSVGDLSLAARNLEGRVALVTGASRGIGRGVALALGEAGATVYATGRSAVDETVDLIAEAGGRGVAIRCDHRDDTAVGEAFARVERDAGRLDLLVNNAAAIPDLSVLFSDEPFWRTPVELWDDLMTVGLRSHFVAAQHAVPIMLRGEHGLIVNVSSAGAVSKIGIVPYGVGKAALDHMTAEMASDLEATGIVAVSLWPPPTRTEGMLASAGPDTDTAAWSSPRFTGRVIAALVTDPGLTARSGTAIRVRELATELGVPDDASIRR